MTRYTTAARAAADAALFGPPHLYWEATHAGIVQMVSQPSTNSDDLLILADALRQIGNDALFRLAQPLDAQQLLRWADILSDLAPSRANPIEDTH